MCCIAWFAFWVLDALYGLRVSFGGAWLIWLGTWGEAAVLSRRGAMRTLGDLALCRLRVYPLDDSRCTNCGYSLFGLPSNRCPECGQTFTQRPADAAQTPTFAGAAE